MGRVPGGGVFQNGRADDGEGNDEAASRTASLDVRGDPERRTAFNRFD